MFCLAPNKRTVCRRVGGGDRYRCECFGFGVEGILETGRDRIDQHQKRSSSWKLCSPMPGTLPRCSGGSRQNQCPSSADSERGLDEINSGPPVQFRLWGDYSQSKQYLIYSGVRLKRDPRHDDCTYRKYRIGCGYGQRSPLHEEPLNVNTRNLHSVLGSGQKGKTVADFTLDVCGGGETIWMEEEGRRSSNNRVEIPRRGETSTRRETTAVYVFSGVAWKPASPDRWFFPQRYIRSGSVHFGTITGEEIGAWILELSTPQQAFIRFCPAFVKLITRSRQFKSDPRKPI